MLSEEQRGALKALAIKGPEPEKDKMMRWRCLDLRQEVARRFNVTEHDRHVAAPIRPDSPATAAVPFEEGRRGGGGI